MNNSEFSFFASANSGRGFTNYYKDIFDGLKKHYIIKGGPGTGKSSLLKTVAKKAEDKGIKVERFHCSSDPDSLDGIIIKDLSVGITDGTAPHTTDPKYPGIADEIIDIGSCLNKKILNDSRDHIINTIKKKTGLYSDVYSYLEAALELDRIKQRRLSEVTDIVGLCYLARSFSNVIPFTNGKTILRLTEGNTIKGKYTFHPYRTTANIIYNIKDSIGIGYMFLNYIKNMNQYNKLILSYDPLDSEKINMIYIPESKILFCINTDYGEEINLDEFVANEIKDNIDVKINDLLSEAYSLLSEIGNLHFSIEKAYTSAMDFAEKEERQNKLIKEIFS